MYKKTLLVVPALLLTIGCNAENENLAIEENEDTYYSHETNLNANNFRNLSTQRPTIGDDQEKIRIAVNNASGLVPQWVSIVGNTAHVHVNVPQTYSQERKEELEDRLMDAITEAVPRYDIRLNLDER